MTVARWRQPQWLAALLLLELPWLGHQPLVRDEVQSDEAARKTYGALWSSLHHLDAPVGPYYALLHLWIRVSDTATWIRLPSLVAMVGAVAVTIWTAQRLTASLAGPGPAARAGGITGLLLLANPAMWVFAADARPYALALLAASVTLLLTLTAPRQWVLLLVVATAMVYLQGLFVLLVVAEVLWAWRRRERRAVAALAASVVAWLPLAAWSSTETVMTSWIPHTSPVSLAQTVHELFGSAGLLSAVALVAWAVAALAAWPSTAVRGLLPLALAPVLTLAALGLVLHVLGGRYVLYTVLVLAVFLGVGSSVTPPSTPSATIRPAEPSRTRRPPPFVRLLMAALLLLAIDNVIEQARTRYTQDDLPAAASWLVRNDQPGDALLYSPDHARAAFLPELQAVSPAVADQDISADSRQDRRTLGDFYLPEYPEARIEQSLRQHARVWVIGYRGDTWRPTPNTGGSIVSRDLTGWTEGARRTFGQLQITLYLAPTRAR